MPFFFFFLVEVCKYYLILIPPSASIKQLQTGQCCILTKKNLMHFEILSQSSEILVPVTDFAAISGVASVQFTVQQQEHTPNTWNFSSRLG